MIEKDHPLSLAIVRHGDFFLCRGRELGFTCMCSFVPLQFFCSLSVGQIAAFQLLFSSLFSTEIFVAASPAS